MKQRVAFFVICLSVVGLFVGSVGNDAQACVTRKQRRLLYDLTTTERMRATWGSSEILALLEIPPGQGDAYKEALSDVAAHGGCGPSDSAREYSAEHERIARDALGRVLRLNEQKRQQFLRLILGDNPNPERVQALTSNFVALAHERGTDAQMRPAHGADVYWEFDNHAGRYRPDPDAAAAMAVAASHAAPVVAPPVASSTTTVATPRPAAGTAEPIAVAGQQPAAASSSTAATAQAPVAAPPVTHHSPAATPMGPGTQVRGTHFTCQETFTSQATAFTSRTATNRNNILTRSFCTELGAWRNHYASSCDINMRLHRHGRRSATQGEYNARLLACRCEYHIGAGNTPLSKNPSREVAEQIVVSHRYGGPIRSGDTCGDFSRPWAGTNANGHRDSNQEHSVLTPPAAGAH